MAGEIDLFDEITPSRLLGLAGDGTIGPVKTKDVDRLFKNLPSICPTPTELQAIFDKYPIEVGYVEQSGVRKATPTGWTAFGEGNTDPYARCRNGNKYYVDPVAGNDSTGTGTSANPFQRVTAAQAAANTAGQPCAIVVRATGRIGRTSGSLWGSVVPTVPTAYLASGGVVTIGSFDNYAYSADATNNWTYRITGGRSSVTAIFDISRFDRFGHAVPLLKVASAAACARIPGSWFMDASSTPPSPVIHMHDETAPSNATLMVLIDPNGGDGMDKTMGNNPQHIFFDGETLADSWDVRGQRIKTFATAYGSEDKIAGFRNVSVKYIDFVNADNRNAFSLDNWRGIGWYENCYAGKIAYDSFNGHKSLTGSSTLMVTVNCKSEDCGISGPLNIGSQNSYTMHEDIVSIDIAGDYRYSRGANVAIVNSSQTLMHGTRISGDRGDIEIAAGTNHPTEVRTSDTAKLWLSEVILEPSNGGFAINAKSSNPVVIRNMLTRGKVAGNVTNWA